MSYLNTPHRIKNCRHSKLLKGCSIPLPSIAMEVYVTRLEPERFLIAIGTATFYTA